jgi:hypothetical protein
MRSTQRLIADLAAEKVAVPNLGRRRAGRLQLGGLGRWAVGLPLAEERKAGERGCPCLPVVASIWSMVP